MEPFPEVPGVEFRNVPGTVCYAVSSDGRVWSSSTRNGTRPPGWYPLSISRRQGAIRYSVVWLREDEGRGRAVRYYVHRLVLSAFVGPPPAGAHGMHTDGNPENNSLGNLSWGTAKQNAADRIRHGTVLRGERHPMAKLSSEQVAAIRAIGNRMLQREIAAMFGVTQTTVSTILLGKKWKSKASGC